MQHLKEFLTKIQTFNFRLTHQEGYISSSSNEKRKMLGYDIRHETHYYDSFSYKSELRVLKDMALIDLLALDQDRIGMQLLQLKKVEQRFKQLWGHYHNNHYGYMASRYNASYPFSIRINDLFIVNNLQPDHAEIAVTEEFVEDL